jgi:hypothetical protein
MLTALNCAHEYPDADAVYLISDGLPDDTLAIHRAVQAAGEAGGPGWNGTGRAMLPVHAIGIRPDGKGERFLKKLAADTGGAYVRFDDVEADDEGEDEDEDEDDDEDVKIPVDAMRTRLGSCGERWGLLEASASEEEEEEESVAEKEMEDWTEEKKVAAGGAAPHGDGGGGAENMGDGSDGYSDGRMPTFTTHAARVLSGPLRVGRATSGITVGSVVVAGVRGGGAGTRSPRGGIIGSSLGDGDGNGNGGILGVLAEGVDHVAARAVTAPARRQGNSAPARHDPPKLIKDSDADVEWVRAAMEEEARWACEADDGAGDGATRVEIIARVRVRFAALRVAWSAVELRQRAAAAANADRAHAVAVVVFDAQYGRSSAMRVAHEAYQAAQWAEARSEHSQELWQWALALVAGRVVSSRRAKATAAPWRQRREQQALALAALGAEVAAALEEKVARDAAAAAMFSAGERRRVDAVNAAEMARLVTEHRAALSAVVARNTHRAAQRRRQYSARMEWFQARDEAVVASVARWAVASGAASAALYLARRDAMQAYDAKLQAATAENLQRRANHTAATHAFDQYSQKAEARRHAVALSANAHRLATREALIASERAGADADRAWSLATDVVHRANIEALRVARAAFDNDGGVRAAQAKAAELEHLAMETAMREHHKSLEVTDSLFQWRSTRHRVAHERDTIRQKLTHVRQQAAAAVTHQKAGEARCEAHDGEVARWKAQCKASLEAAEAAFREEAAAVEDANAVATAVAAAAHDAAVTAAVAHNALWGGVVERKMRALAELERVRAFNDTVVSAAAATRAGTKRVVETATLTAALTSAFA